MRPYLSLLWTTREGTSFKGSFSALGFCPLQSGVGDPGVGDPCGSATELASNVLGQLPGHSGCFQSAPLNHCYGEATEVSPQHSLCPAQGWHSLTESRGEWGRDHSQLEDGTSQSQGAEKWRWVGSVVLPRRCQFPLHRSVSVLWVQVWLRRQI